MKNNLLSIDARMLFAGGIGTYIQNLLKRLKFEELGLRVEIYVRTDAEEAWVREHQPQATIKRCPYWIYGFKEQFFWLKNIKGGAFWAPHYNIPWGGYEKLIVTLHDALPLTNLLPWYHRAYAKVVYWRLRKKVDAILTVSNFSCVALSDLAGIKKIPMTVTYHGVDEAWFAPKLTEPPYDFPYLVYVGNLKPHKNLVRLLQAFQRVSSSVRLVCVGPFKNLKARDERALRMLRQTAGRVIATDYVAAKDLLSIVKNSMGLVLPSTYEGFGLPPLEAMAARVPVLVSNTSAMPEVCGSPAIYCDPYSVESIAEGLNKLIDLKGPEREHRINEGYENAKKFTWEKTAAQTSEVFRKTLA